MTYKFPNNFLWGAATSSHQIEGDNINNDWWEAEQGIGLYSTEQKRLLPYKSGKACDSYNRYEEDFDLAKAMNNNAHRFSIEWSRIEPEEGKFNQEEIEHYRKVIQAIRRRGLEPFVTLHHFTNPLWFAKLGGWTNKKSPEYFERYAKKIVEELGDLVTYWITINEPIITVSQGYLNGTWPPFCNKDILGWFGALGNMAEAHKFAYRALHKHSHCAEVGVAKSVNCFEPTGAGFLKTLSSFRTLLYRWFKNEWFLNGIKNHQDFIGLNYYNHYKVSLLKGKLQDGKNKSDFGWEIYPEGIYHVVKEIYKKYKKPIYITENGIADADDDQRQDFIRDHLAWLSRAMTETYRYDRKDTLQLHNEKNNRMEERDRGCFGGADVRGYFYWSLLDNFEWAEGFTQRFGLVEVDFETFERKMRPSGKLYGEICKDNGF